MTSDQPHLLLHTYFRSSCTARVRTALHLKNLPYEPSYLHLLQKEHLSPTYSTINPSASVPTLTITPSSGPKIVIRQSVAILEFLDEYFPDTPQLLPPLSDPVRRAKVRELVNILVADVQPPTNLRNLRRLKKIAKGDEEVVNAWAKEIMIEGLRAFDALAEKYSEGGRYSVGDEVTMADVVLAPAVEGAFRYGVEVKRLGTVWRIYEEIKGIEAFRRGSWKCQEDTPEELREKE
ncbi:Maleylacetoacetate isomerase [Mollisia scopiformis]|uniref:Maleylacetoacetate isomerase n=1 Tax=Mollisia scopiformis TaxID=149040 RepID=A0A132B318_MOLSC|nr:Maleylacetoacetate isomerase [Mollisia scopiformis]KUJ06798.1 Maleylacetoacetate isomerase [Mollisia scopiformis]